MSGSPQVRRVDKVMTEECARETLERGFCGRLASVGEDGWPYCVPLLYVCMDGEVFVHNTRARGHLRANADHEPRVCFEIDEAASLRRADGEVRPKRLAAPEGLLSAHRPDHAVRDHGRAHERQGNALACGLAALARGGSHQV